MPMLGLFVPLVMVQCHVRQYLDRSLYTIPVKSPYSECVCEAQSVVEAGSTLGRLFHKLVHWSLQLGNICLEEI